MNIRPCLGAALAWCAAFAAPAQPPVTPPPHDSGNVVLVMIDGLRWQEVFSGADQRYMTKDVGNVEKPETLAQRWGGETAGVRREKLMPFLWSVVAKEGQLFGNREKASRVDITNGFGVSYPGYAETLCGVAEPFIKDNRHIPNPNPTVLEFLNSRPAFAGRVAAFGSWETFRVIFRADVCGFPVDDGTKPFTRGTLTEEIRTINRLREEIPYRWGSVCFDALTFNLALSWIDANAPRAVFVGLGETDEWAHEYDYAKYLDAAHRSDAYLARLWEMLQSRPDYRGTTTLVVCPDHGRGDLAQSERAWGDHGQKYAGSSAIWLGVIGPRTPALGERTDAPPIFQNQIAATIAAAVGEDFLAAQPRAGLPIADVLSRSRSSPPAPSP